MPIMKKLLLLVTSFVLLNSSCKKSKPTNPVDQLPPETQTGANTFGCLVNGKVYIPKGSTGMGKPNYRVMVDPSYNDGQFSINCYQVINDNETQFLDFGSDSIKGSGKYPLTIGGRLRIAWSSGSCKTDVFDTISYRYGNLIITRYDLQAGIFSGEFEFTYKPPNCDTIKITNGRFDYKF